MPTIINTRERKQRNIFTGFVLSFPLLLTACGGSGGTATPSPVAPAPPTPPVAQNSKAFKTEDSTARFLGKATFGARKADIDAFKGGEVSDWMLAQFNKQPTHYRERVTALVAKRFQRMKCCSQIR